MSRAISKMILAGLAISGLALAAGQSVAGPIEDAAAGRTALDRGDYPAAIQLLTAALRSDGLNRAERVLALVKRADAELAVDRRAEAIADADAALALDKADPEAVDVRTRALGRTDAEAADVRVRSQVSIIGRGEAPALAPAESLNGEVEHFNEGVAARNAASAADYGAGVAQYNTQVKSDADAYAQARAAYQAQLQALDAKRRADLASWRKQVKACRHGRVAECAAPVD